jgi:predicted DNA-binding transcriptional regulator AlpA
MKEQMTQGMSQEGIAEAPRMFLISEEKLTAFAEMVAEATIRKFEKSTIAAAKNRERLIPVDEAMEILRVGRTTLWQWDKKGFLPVVKLGQKVLYRACDIDKVLNHIIPKNERK